jgi:hypothetical protein
MMGLLLRRPLEDTIVGQVVRGGTGYLDIDAGRISTTDSLDGGDTANGKRSELYGDRPWMHDEEVLEARKVEAVEKVKRAESLGRFPSNVLLLHGPNCECVGTKKVKASNQPGRGGEDEGTTERGVGFGSSDQKFEGSIPFYTDPSDYGKEEVADWRCQSSCPVRHLDVQSLAGGMHAAGHARDGSTAVVADSYDANAYEMGPDRNMSRYGDEGGASRFFKQATTLDDLQQYLTGLTCLTPTRY